MIYICLLRGINVGGNKRIKMADLRQLLGNLSLKNVQTILQSGNVVFESDETNQDKLIKDIEASIEDAYGFEVKVMLRTAEEWQAIIDKKPNYDFEVAGNRLLVVCLDTVPKPENIKELVDSHRGDEIIYVFEQELFIYYGDGMGKSKLSNTVLERKLSVTTTARNWNTVIKLQALAEKS